MMTVRVTLIDRGDQKSLFRKRLIGVREEPTSFKRRVTSILNAQRHYDDARGQRS